MSAGTYISLTLHAVLVGWLLFGGDFDHKPREVPVTEVSVVSAEIFDILVNNIPPSVDTSLEKAATQPDIEQSERPIDPVMDVAPEKTTQSLSPNVQNDTLPESVPDKPVRMEEVVIIPPVDLTELKVEDPKLLEMSLAPKPRPTLRVAPVAVAPPAPDIDIGDITRDAAAPQVDSVEVAQEQTAKVPEAVAPEIVTEAEPPSEAVKVSKLAPPRSVRPQRRPTPRPVGETSIDPPEPTPVPIDPMAAALAEALSAKTPASSNQRVSSALEAAMNNAMRDCNNRGGLSSAAAATTVVVSITFSADGRPVPEAIKLVEYIDGSENNAKVRFEAYKRGVLNSECVNKMANIYRKGVQNEQLSVGVPLEFVVPPGEP